MQPIASTILLLLPFLLSTKCADQEAPQLAPLEDAPSIDEDFYQQMLQGKEDEGFSLSVWPSEDIKLGQVVGLAIDKSGDVHVFHRGERVWDESSFGEDNTFKHKNEGPIKQNTRIVIDHETGEIKKKCGADVFYMPHGMSIDHEDNVWLTDVATHQIYKFAPDSDKMQLVLGEKFVPGSDEKHFCKPTDVAVARSGEFFVGDGYCNSRIIKFSKDGKFMTSFGRAADSSIYPPPASSLHIPHSLALVEDWNLLCVADRENERIQCFTAGLANSERKSLPTGMLLKSAENLGRVFAIRARKHYLYGVTNMGLTGGENRVFKVDLRNGDAITEAPGLVNPHAIAVADDETVYIGESGPNRILKIE